MPTEEHADTALGLLSSIVARLEEILDVLRRPDEWGAIDSVQRVSWPAGGSADVNERGKFRSVVVLNENAFDINVGLAPGAAVAGRAGTIVLPARCYVVLPARDVTVSVGAAAAGTAVVIPLAITQQFSAGKLA